MIIDVINDVKLINGRYGFYWIESMYFHNEYSRYYPTEKQAREAFSFFGRWLLQYNDL